ncbi:MAG: O-antigen ligase family protein [Bacteroidales bacterium]|nr:O-antigen ligase family protein [Bacteroidales bacterium]
MKRLDIHYSIYLLGVIVLMASIPLSHFLMGLVCFILFLNWIAEWDWKDKWTRAKQNWQGLFLAGLFFVSLLGLVKTNDWNAAGHAILAQLPMLFAPIIMITSRPFSQKAMDWLLNTFILATFFGCICSVIYWKTHTINDIREISVFIDHIRFSLCIVLSMVLCMHYAIKRTELLSWYRGGYVVLILHMLLYLFFAQTLTGIIIAFVIAFVYLFYLLFKMPQQRLKWMIFSILVLLILGGSAYVTYITYTYFHDKDTMIMARQTPNGNPYSFEFETMVENGHRIDYYVCKPELMVAWGERSDSAYSELREQTLIRYLNSKGMRKDYVSVMALSDADIHHVESGIANCDYTKSFGLRRALYPTFFSFTMYKKCGYIDNSSLLQRVELWRASMAVLKDNWFWGVGLGDNKTALDNQLEKQQSAIAYKHNRGSHNQFITYWMMGGVLLLAYFLFVLAYPFFGLRNRITFVYVAFFIMLFLSMLTEDTISSQSGRIMFSVINPLLLLYFGALQNKTDQ